MAELFGTDGIRGVAGRYPMTAEMALKIGKAVAHSFSRPGHTPKIAIGRDTRLSGPMLESAFAAGACSMGATVLKLGVMPTPGVALLTRSLRADAGIVISASHNPYQDNGIKIFSGEGFKLPDEREAAIEAHILADDLVGEPERIGHIIKVDNARGRYIDFLKESLAGSLEGLKLVLDCSNGATFKVAPATFAELGATVVTLYAEPDGRNINAGCGSQHPEKLAEAVVAEGARLGLAFDGDGDRVIAVDETGRVLTGDQILVICGAALKRQGKLVNDTVVGTVMSNLGFGLALKDLGIKTLTANVGDRYVLEQMQASGAVLGGEDSGHIIMLEHHTTGDGILAGLQLIAAMLSEAKPLSDLAARMQVFPQILENIDVKAKPDLATVPAVAAVISAVENELGERGRVLVRYSGTQSMCRVMVEGPTEAVTREACARIAAVVRRELA